MARQKKNASKSSLTISIIFHAVLVLLLVYWAAREGVLGEKMKSITAVIIPKEKKPEPPKEIAKPVEKPKEVVEAKQPEPTQPPPDQAPPPSTSTPPPPAVQPSTIAAPPAAVAPSFVFTDGTRPIPVTTNPPVVVAPRPRLTPERTFFSPKTNVGTVVQLLETRQKAAAVTDSFGSEQISKSGTSDAADVVTKISGATIVDGKHAVIRGLSDRYNSTTLNGAEVPSADPYRKSVNIDIFNADVIEKIVTTKSFTPDQPGSFTGGAINIVTKSFPSKPIASFTAGTSYNPQANLNNNFLQDPNGGLSFLGKDPGSRSLPADLANPDLKLPLPPTGGEIRNNPEEATARANQLKALTKSLGTTAFAPVKTTTPLNQSYSGAFGDTIKLFDRPFGFFSGVTYGNNFFSYTDGVQGRYGSSLTPLRISSDSRSIEDVSWSTVVNLAYQLHPDHEISFNFVYSKSSESEAREQIGDDHFVTGNDPSTILIQDTLHHTERDLQTFLLKGNDYFPALANLRLNWLASLSDTTQNEPDLRYFNFYRSPDGNGGFQNFGIGSASLPQPIFPSRFFRNLEEKNQNLRFDAALPFQQWGGLEGELKAGVFGSWSDRNFLEQVFSYRGSAGFDVGNPNTYLNSTNLGEYVVTISPTGRTNYTFIRYLTSEIGNNKSDGELAVKAGYLMTDMPLANRLRVIAGVRYETTDLNVTGGPIGVPPTNSHIEQVDILPAASLIYQLSTNMNLRLSYGRTIARPTFREIANYRSYDAFGDEIIEGNPDLTLSSIDNFDARWEWFMQSGDLLSVSLFYKDLKRPIEKYLRTLDGGIITYINRESAKVYGIEFEARKNLQFIDPLLRPFSIGANVALIQSEVPLTDVELINKRAFDPGVSSTRPLYDQSPYIINVDLSYQNIYTHTIATLLYNLAGSRIYIATGQGPDIYEHPAASLDFVLTQQLTRNLRFKFYAKNLLDPVFERTYGDNPGKFVYSSFTRGRTFGLSLSCDL